MAAAQDRVTCSICMASLGEAAGVTSHSGAAAPDHACSCDGEAASPAGLPAATLAAQYDAVIAHVARRLRQVEEQRAGAAEAAVAGAVEGKAGPTVTLAQALQEEERDLQDTLARLQALRDLPFPPPCPALVWTQALSDVLGLVLPTPMTGTPLADRLDPHTAEGRPGPYAVALNVRRIVVKTCLEAGEGETGLISLELAVPGVLSGSGSTSASASASGVGQPEGVSAARMRGEQYIRGGEYAFATYEAVVTFTPAPATPTEVDAAALQAYAAKHAILTVFRVPLEGERRVITPPIAKAAVPLAGLWEANEATVTVPLYGPEVEASAELGVHQGGMRVVLPEGEAGPRGSVTVRLSAALHLNCPARVQRHPRVREWPAEPAVAAEGRTSRLRLVLPAVAAEAPSAAAAGGAPSDPQGSAAPAPATHLPTGRSSDVTVITGVTGVTQALLVFLQPSTTLNDLKHALAAPRVGLGLSVDQQALYDWNLGPLPDTAYIAPRHARWTVVLRRVDAAPMVQVFVKTLTGRNYSVWASPDDSSTYLKLALQDRADVQAQQQRLIFEGRELQDEQGTLGSVGIQKDSQLHMVLHLRRDGM